MRDNIAKRPFTNMSVPKNNTKVGKSIWKRKINICLFIIM